MTPLKNTNVRIHILICNVFVCIYTHTFVNIGRGAKVSIGNINSGFYSQYLIYFYDYFIIYFYDLGSKCHQAFKYLYITKINSDALKTHVRFFISKHLYGNNKNL